MTNIVKKASCNRSAGVIQFLCKDNACEPLPQDYSDPLALLGDIKILNLDTTQKKELREILNKEVTTNGAKDVWDNRTFRKNLILSFGKVV
ncbi:hypothetical protein [Maridesulfovibrio ferrireducens]|uniref:Uncharacterized protein n=1 Tax=Maridesulfovibrio ferrireducens TaxID=246191 RepID=A0A1G9FYN3_9BACT|nr:hypothetical protein [Maridesulfovibrio ferrireducens]MBI9109867.1 hypothetical protein [Maridesulfovibrio ferrireducens]SDK93425.1 hypothetical protein SAMN05660337_1759 [Maridesulfovibrio ferrireducens]